MENEKDFFAVIKVGPFFKQYCPEVPNFYHKSRKEDGNRRPIDFTKEDRARMKAAANRLAADLKKIKF